MDHVSLNLVETFDEAESFMRWLGERRPILACDTETGGLEWWKDDLRLVQFGDLATGWAIPWQGWGGLAADALRRYTGDLAFHNLKFDMKFLETNGVALRHDRLHDTRSMAHILDPDNPTGLKPLGVRFVDGGADAGQAELKKGMAKNRWTWATVPTTFVPYWSYAALDPVLTAHLHQGFRPQIVGRLEDVYELEVAVIIVLDEMERRGARVDLSYCEARRSELLDFAEQTAEWCQSRYGFTPGANKQVAARLLTDGVVLTKRTDSGAWSVDESVLADLPDNELARMVLKWRKARKYANAYFGNYLELADGDLLHPDVNPLGARTGRMSISRPALQQIPREKLLRDPFIPRDGNRLVSVDFDQIEQRLMAHFSGDAGMIDAFAQDGDFFTNMARRIFNDASIKKDDPRRQRTKNAAYAKAYGSGVAKFAETAQIDEGEAQLFLNSYDATFPGVRAFQRQLEQLARQRLTAEGEAYVTTPLGRRQPADPEKLYTLVNYLIQGTAADIFKQSLVDLDRAGLTEFFILPVHDEAVFDVPAADAEDLAQAVVSVFSRQDWTVPLTAGADILERWGEKYA